MKKLAFYMLMLVMGIGYAHAQGQADIKFDKERNNQDYLQRYGQIPRTLQEVHYVAQQCQDRNAPALCGRRHDCQRRQIIVFMIQNKGEFFNSPFFLLSLKPITDTYRNHNNKQ